MTAREPAVLTTRRQTFMQQALEHVGAFADAHPLAGVTDEQRKANKSVRDAYGGLCHTFPALILQDGLCQAVAFVHEKKTSAEGGRKDAFEALWADIARTLNVPPDGTNGLLHRVQHDGVGDYLRHTHRLLEAWIYYKRFAVSLLDVQPGEEPS